MVELKGISASPGIAMGKVFLYMDDNLKVPRYDIEESEVSKEIERFEEAVSKASLEIEELKSRASDKMELEEVSFLDSHILMLQDPTFKSQIEDKVSKDLHNVEWVLLEVVEGFVSKLKASQDNYLRERAIDFHDVSKRVLNHLLYREKISLSELKEEIILITHNLLPSDALAMNKRMVKGICMDAGGKTSHTAILARSFEIPAVVGAVEISKRVQTGDFVIIDGNEGIAIINPDEDTLEKYSSSQKEWQLRESLLLDLNELPAETQDGKLIYLKANIEVPEEIESVWAHGADGIGLYRSEFIFMKPGHLETEDIQFQAYAEVLEAMNGKEVTIRTLDVGGDKNIPGIEGLNEKNPILGWRAVRFCLSRIDLFKIQLRALLRASMFGKLRIMFPMISGLEELEKVLAVLETVKDELRKEGIPFREDIPVGIMIEVPSAALVSDLLAKKVSFFSIGTNDLIQYTIAVDRGNEKIAYLYEPLHIGVIRLIKTVIENAHAQSIPVSMCGEMAGDPLYTVILLGLGLDEFSMSSFRIPETKRIIRSVSMSEAEELVGNIMEMRSYKEIDSYVKNWMDKKIDYIS